MKRAIAVTAIAIAGVSLAGCGGGQADSTTSTTSAVWTKSEAAKQYLAMVAPGNKSINAWKNKTLSPHNIREYTKAYTVHQDAFVRKLAAGRWPAFVKADINRLIRASNAGRQASVDVYTAKTEDAAWAVWTSTKTETATRAAVADVRTKLGLPPPPD